MEPLAPILSLIASDPGSTAGVFGVLAMFAFLFLKFRQAGLESVTSVSKLHADQVTELIKQNRELANDLDVLRKKMGVTLDQLDALKNSVVQLKTQLAMYELYCSECPRKPK